MWRKALREGLRHAVFQMLKIRARPFRLGKAERNGNACSNTNVDVTTGGHAEQ